MKEYKVISWKIGLSGKNQKLEDTLNSFAKKRMESYKYCRAIH